ncbi:4-(cytidine 5'-diphospho)-2-C-methyl-D-erythritol kinase [Corynebacterium sp. HMSC08D02]|uniref:4-(cytidine 5'-diphospho)-2-C-methyl-D-erythritol kinase n=1 Tax=Corynebacterium sp. HMSC08D02 TaxID=1581138 RepID=UPI0008A396D3|nr:4-(cytidine 5'-diphospho)-2-C-methyl-D-erythritol kinase [Corynebacterium sp. HMSC08D02]OFT28510.1 4-(cytidine 5'-diphospho)-2-C-methyl-D-erythritol kinase [Corynebacterium sp. HMSC08D02]
MSSSTREIVASAPGKVNLHLGVGNARADGYHELVTVFQAVERRERVRIVVEDEAACVESGSVVVGMQTHFHVDVPDEDIDTPRNLTWRAVDAVVDAVRARSGVQGLSLPKAKLVVDKHVFVAGGMAGGSADAAAGLVAANAYVERYCGERLSEEDLYDLAAGLGADVPFALHGHTALGTGRGDALVEVLGRGTYWWVFCNPKIGISTGKAFETLDDLRHDNPALVPHLDTAALSQALVTGDPRELAKHLHNDLEAAAVAMRPRIAALITRIESETELVARAIVSGSGPTIAALCFDEEAARTLETVLRDSVEGVEVFCTSGPSAGAQLEA